MRGSHRAAAWGIRLLLPLLLLGLVMMHTFGHSTPHGSSQTLGAPIAAAPHGCAGDSEYLAPLVPHAAGTPKAAAPNCGTDPAPVCMAVLEAWTAGLPASGCLSHGPADAVATAGGQLPHALRPMPPPGGRALLSRLSVLRL